MDNAYIGEIRATPYNFAPEGWFLCDGSLVPIMQCQALYAVIGELYGSKTQTSFRLPNLCSRAIIGTDVRYNNLYRPGLTDGNAQESININQMGTHNHSVNANKHVTAQMSLATNVPNQNVFLSNMLATTPDAKTPGLYAYSANGTTSENNALVGPFGNMLPTPHDNMMPYTSFRYIICWNGEFPIHD